MNGQSPATVGGVLRTWRRQRRLSQLDLALDADLSQRHLSFIESGRSAPSREMLLRIADRLDMPLRARNGMLIAGGYAPIFPERGLDDPSLEPARRALDLMLENHEPFPALVINRHWNLVSANRGLAPLLNGVREPVLLEPPINVLRLSLHPAGLAPQILNLNAWREHLIDRLRNQIDLSGDPVLIALKEEISGYPTGKSSTSQQRISTFAGFVVPLELESDAGRLSFFSTTTVFGTPLDVTLAELAMESFFPANAATAEVMRRLSRSR